MDSRLARETEFHNKRFAAGTRGGNDAANNGPVDKFYSITRSSLANYWDSIREGCSGKQFLEYGCGTGGFAFRLAKQHARVVGIDISGVAVEKARMQAEAEHLEGMRFLEMNAEQLSFPDNTFDVICGSAILHHLDLTNAFPEIARALKPGGKAVFLEPLGHNPLINLYRKWTPDVRTPDEHPLLMKDLKFAGTSFEKVEFRCFHLLSLAAVPFRRYSFFNRLVRGCDRIDSSLFRLVPLMKRHAWSAVITLSRPFKYPS